MVQLFIGEFKNGKRHGKGNYYFSNGDQWEGEWFHDRQHGKGILK